MLIRLAANAGVHFAGGIVLGALGVVAGAAAVKMAQQRRDGRTDDREPAGGLSDDVAQDARTNQS